MRVLILVPPDRSTTGNRCTADRYAALLQELGHDVQVGDALAGDAPDLLVAIHAAKSHDRLVAARARHPALPVVLVLAGTDIYPSPSPNAQESMQLADRLVALQGHAVQQVPSELRHKVQVILQSAVPEDLEVSLATPEHFDLCVVGHLREVKDPLRAAAAARLLPADSRIRIRHAGRIRDEALLPLVKREQHENPRYLWLGELDPRQARELIASCRLQVLSSRHEGGAQVLSESIVSGTPLLCSRHEAAVAVLGDDYPGLFDIGDTEALAALMSRAETDSAFLGSLDKRTAALAPLFAPERERAAWSSLISGLCGNRCGAMNPGESS